MSVEIRQSQVVTTWGPGAMVDLPDEAIIVAGLEHWHYEAGQRHTIDEPRLVATLRRLLCRDQLSLRMPPPKLDLPTQGPPHIMGFRFPGWYLVQHEEEHNGRRRRRLVSASALQNGRFVEGCDRYDVVPVRFVRACPKGHVEDIWWRPYVHQGAQCTDQRLWVEERGTTGDLNDVWIICGCGRSRPMSDAAIPELKALGDCGGARPWLGRSAKEECGIASRLLIRNASNAYFPQLLSVISIPASQAAIDDVVASAWDLGLNAVETVEQLAMFRTAIKALANLLEGYDNDSLFEAIARRKSGGHTPNRSVKDLEFDALAQSGPEVVGESVSADFHARALPPARWTADWMHGVERLVLVHRLREVTALVGFTRFEAATPDIGGDLDLNVERASLTLTQNWLPAVENRGEGLFLQFSKEAMDRWCHLEKVVEHGRVLEQGFNNWKDERNSRRSFPGLPYYMLHTLSHLLMTAVSLDCGYAASSLRERIYAAPGNYGLLIFTGSSDAEGTLGGLVSTARDIRRHLRSALEYATLCSNDPICSAHTPKSDDRQYLLGSACHGCVLVPETSCEQFNCFLDRSLVVPTVEDRGVAFFDGLL